MIFMRKPMNIKKVDKDFQLSKDVKVLEEKTMQLNRWHNVNELINFEYAIHNALSDAMKQFPKETEITVNYIYGIYHRELGFSHDGYLKIIVIADTGKTKEAVVFNQTEKYMEDIEMTDVQAGKVVARLLLPSILKHDRFYNFMKKIVDKLPNEKWYGMGIGPDEEITDFEWEYYESAKKHWYTVGKRWSIVWDFKEDGFEIEVLKNWDEHNPIESAFYDGPNNALKSMATNGFNVSDLTIGEFGWISQIAFRKIYKYDNLENEDVISDLLKEEYLKWYLTKKETVK
ncbi:hypothetical protein NHG29_03215 [Aerococcaceae bacterium NML160702]|nr:hypothetical protein [Aerococcaceae bacterium NML160702]